MRLPLAANSIYGSLLFCRRNRVVAGVDPRGDSLAADVLQPALMTRKFDLQRKGLCRGADRSARLDGDPRPVLVARSAWCGFIEWFGRTRTSRLSLIGPEIRDEEDARKHCRGESSPPRASRSLGAHLDKRCHLISRMAHFGNIEMAGQSPNYRHLGRRHQPNSGRPVTEARDPGDRPRRPPSMAWRIINDKPNLGYFRHTPAAWAGPPAILSNRT